jgi:hypothetical protein
MRFRFAYLLKLLVLVQMTSCELFAETLHGLQLRIAKKVCQM